MVVDDRIFMNAEVPIDLAIKARVQASKLNMSRSELIRIAVEMLLVYLGDGGELEVKTKYICRCATEPYAKGLCKNCYHRQLYHSKVKNGNAT